MTAGTTLAGLPELPTRGSNLGNVVMIDDDPVTLRILRSHLRAVRCELRGHEDAEIGLQAVDEETRAALIDLNMPGMDGFECLHFLRKHHPRVQVIVLTGSQQTTDAVEAMRAGAFQFVTKPWDPDQLQVYLYKAFQAWQNETDRHELRESRWHNLPVPMDARDREAGDIHEQLQHQVNRIAGLDSTVFIAGESGTGKSTVARWIHQKSARRDGPFVTVNCAALPRDLLTSELFGHTKGAFTGADRDRAGHAEVADGGTLFLDEIGDLPLELQPKLLTFLQDRTIQRLGSTDVRSVDVRLIVATHRDLNIMCRDRLFREDLYFRLMVLPIELPPLRLRQGEAPEMAREILLGICRRMGMPPKSISPAAMRVLLEHSWPGNIRELENVLERAAAFSSSELLQPQDLVIRPLQPHAADRGPSPAIVDGVEEDHEDREDREAADAEGCRDAEATVGDPASKLEEVFFGKTWEEIERLAIVATLSGCEGNKAKSARMLGISEKSIYNKMRRLSITWPMSETPPSGEPCCNGSN